MTQAHASLPLSSVFTAGAPSIRCRGCGVALAANGEDDAALEACSFCAARPQDLPRRVVAGHAGALRESPSVSLPKPAERPPAPVPPTPLPRPTAPNADFTPLEISLITRMHKLLPRQELLNVINDRRRGHSGAAAAPRTLDQLEAKVAALGLLPQAPARSWAGFRKLLAAARREGTLGQITEQTIDDFAIVFSLNARQVTELKDIVLVAADEDRREGSAQ